MKHRVWRILWCATCVLYIGGQNSWLRYSFTPFKLNLIHNFKAVFVHSSHFLQSLLLSNISTTLQIYTSTEPYRVKKFLENLHRRVLTLETPWWFCAIILRRRPSGNEKSSLRCSPLICQFGVIRRNEDVVCCAAMSLAESGHDDARSTFTPSSSSSSTNRFRFLRSLRDLLFRRRGRRQRRAGLPSSSTDDVGRAAAMPRVKSARSLNDELESRDIDSDSGTSHSTAVSAAAAASSTSAATPITTRLK